MIRSSLKPLVFVVVLLAAVLFALTYRGAVLYSSSDETDQTGSPGAAAAPTVVREASSAPARIRIPAIGVNADIEHVGLGKTGNMAVPLQYADAAWYRSGTLPGNVGSAVIDGHVDNGLATPAVFYNLHELKPGDDIYIDAGDGSTTHFVVEETKVYALADVPLNQLFNRADKARLNLITCDGAWIAEKKMYDERRVVYAVLAV